MNPIEYIENVMVRTGSNVALLDAEQEGKFPTMILIYRKQDAFIIWRLKIMDECLYPNIPAYYHPYARKYAEGIMHRNDGYIFVEKLPDGYIYAFKKKLQYVVIRRCVKVNSTVYIRNPNAKIKLI